MSRIGNVVRICRSLADRGWNQVFLEHGLNLKARDLETALERPLPIDRGKPGFADFCLSGHKGVTPCDPAKSLLYHALASPDVHPRSRGGQIAAAAYPSLAELDEIENYIYSLKPLKLDASTDLIIGVFAYEYRPAASGAHGYHADLVFSRTGVARVGTARPAWYGPWRNFRPDPLRRDGISVCPARYGAFVVGTDDDKYNTPVMGRWDEQDDPTRTFYVPTHKLFPGPDCIEGVDLELVFREYHRNEKLMKLHTTGQLETVEGFDVKSHPFIRDSLNGGDLVKLVPCGASVLVAPRARPTLVRTTTQLNALTGNSELVRFTVPAQKRGNRFSTSLQMDTDGDARTVPEYVNIRHLVKEKRAGKFSISDLKKFPNKKFKALLKNGDYEAAHFIDDTCDGCVTVTLHGLFQQLQSLPAYSLVAAPHFFPLADQLQISNWVRRSLINYQEQFAQGSPWPLCEGRRPANIELPRPENLMERAFGRDDDTVTAIVSQQPRSRQYNAPDRSKCFASHLTDAASNEFDPGWDISMGGDDEGNYLAAYGLGSPFPEDAKLCAALNSFWPAAAPDASRTFAIECGPTAMPLLDEEIGYHPRHPLVRAKKVKSSYGWDGEQGPFFERSRGSQHINAADIDRSDYVSNALANKIDIRRTSSASADEIIHRMDALRRCVEVLPPKNDWVSSSELLLVTAEKIDDWAKEKERAHKSLSGPGYIYVFAKFNKKEKIPTADVARVRYVVLQKFECQICRDVVVFRVGQGRWRVSPLPSLDFKHHDQILMSRRPERAS
jgi:hypothetical protein